MQCERMGTTLMEEGWKMRRDKEGDIDSRAVMKGLGVSRATAVCSPPLCTGRLKAMTSPSTGQLGYRGEVHVRSIEHTRRPCRPDGMGAPAPEKPSGATLERTRGPTPPQTLAIWLLVGCRSPRRVPRRRGLAAAGLLSDLSWVFLRQRLNVCRPTAGHCACAARASGEGCCSLD